MKCSSLGGGPGRSSLLLGLSSGAPNTPQPHRIHHSICCEQTHTGAALGNIRAAWPERNCSCFNSCPNGWYRVCHVSASLQGPPLTCCYIMLACVLFGSVWYSVVGSEVSGGMWGGVQLKARQEGFSNTNTKGLMLDVLCYTQTVVLHTVQTTDGAMFPMCLQVLGVWWEIVV